MQLATALATAVFFFFFCFFHSTAAALAAVGLLAYGGAECLQGILEMGNINIVGLGGIGGYLQVRC